MLIPFATNSYAHDSLPISAQRTVNLYAERQPPDAKTQVSVHGAPGIVTFATCGEGPIRGAHVMGGLLYVVSGPWLYSVTNAATPVATRLGGQVTGSGVVSIDDNGTELCITNGASGYLYSTTGGFRAITDASFGAANRVTFMNGFFLVDRVGTGEVFRSDLLDGSNYDSTASATAESKSDNTQSVFNLKEVLHVFGVETTELWQNTGSANFPFGRIPGAVINRGIIAPLAFATEDESLFLIGNDRIAYKVGGTQLGRISQHAIERTWQKYRTVSDAFGVAKSHNGHKFIIFTFPTEAASWQYDISTGFWSERESRDINGVSLKRWCGNCVVQAYGKTIVGDAFSGQIGYLTDTVFTEFSRPIYAQATGTVLHASRKRGFMSLFELDMEVGVGLTTGQGSDPQVMLDISDDGGRTWSDQQPWQSLGALGNYTKRLRWKRLGNFFQRIMRVTISDPVRRTIIAANADIKIGM